MKSGIKNEMDSILKNSALYKEFLREREEILKHKWIESEKANRDVGFEWALLDWNVRHRAEWRSERDNFI
jgi:hypothetical protein